MSKFTCTNPSCDWDSFINGAPEGATGLVCPICSEKALLDEKLSISFRCPKCKDAYIASSRTGPSINCPSCGGPAPRVQKGKTSGASEENEAERKQSPATPPPSVAEGNSKAGCFIATAACGSEQAEDVVCLRRFRDETLMASSVGRAVVSVYYLASPPIASLVRANAVVRSIVRVAIIRPTRWLIHLTVHGVEPCRSDE